MKASALAEAAGLTRGAMTTALDCIETAGYARRVRHQQDRRTVRVEIADAMRKEIGALYGPLAKQEAFRAFPRSVMSCGNIATFRAAFVAFIAGHDRWRERPR